MGKIYKGYLKEVFPHNWINSPFKQHSKYNQHLRQLGEVWSIYYC
jgi:hypothetical protein